MDWAQAFHDVGIALAAALMFWALAYLARGDK